MSALDLKSALFYIPAEVAIIFRKTLTTNRFDNDGNLVAREGDPDLRWVWKAGRGFLKPAVRRFGRKQTLFLRSEVDRIAAEGAPFAQKKDIYANTQKSYNGNVSDGPGPEGPKPGGANDAEA